MRALPTVLFASIALALGAASAARILGDERLDTPAPAWFGTRAEVRHHLPDPVDGRYSFAALGDIQQGLRAFQDALRHISGKRAVSFGVALGDLVNNETEPHYRLLFAAAEEAGCRVPILTVPGNHDDGTVYDQLVGPRRWHVRVGPDLLVGIDNSAGPPGVAELGGLRNLLRFSKARHRFAFLHRPIAEAGEVREKYRPLADVLARNGVTAVFAGHRHYYEEFELDGVRYVTNGIGGDISGLAPVEAFLTIVTVGPEGVTTRSVSLGARSELPSTTADSLVAHLYAPLRGKGLWTAGILVLFVAAAGAGLASIGRTGLLVAATLTAPALADAPSGSLAILCGWALYSGVLVAVLPGRGGAVGHLVSLAAILVTARSPWFAATAAAFVFFIPSARARVFERRPAIEGFLAGLGALAFLTIWLGPRAPLPMDWVPLALASLALFAAACASSLKSGRPVVDAPSGAGALSS